MNDRFQVEVALGSEGPQSQLPGPETHENVGAEVAMKVLDPSQDLGRVRLGDFPLHLGSPVSVAAGAADREVTLPTR